MLLHRHQLDAVVAHVLDTGEHVVGEFAIGGDFAIY